MSDSETIIRNLEEMEPLREPVLRLAIEALRLPPGSQGLDVGCGIGRQVLLLADAVGPAGHVTGLDQAPELLRYAEDGARAADMAGRTAFREGDMYTLPFADDSFDWAWSVDCVGYPAGAILPALRELVRVVRPGGSVAILGWTAQQLLPGYPLLEARLNASCSAYAPLLGDQPPPAHFLRAARSFHSVGVQAVSAHTLIGEVQAPLSPAVRRALTALFAMLWGAPQPETAPAAWAAYQRLCQPDSPEFILDLPDYYAFFTYTMFRGVC